MIKEVEYNGEIYAIIIRAQHKKHGVEFFTPVNFSQQLGYIQHRKGHVISPHIHNHYHRSITLTQEALFIRKGRVRVDFYDQDQNYIESQILQQNDVILLVNGGHGFEVIEDLEMIEIKQGPYLGEEDKVIFTPKPIKDIKINDR